jgi:hypothetical protein
MITQRLLSAATRAKREYARLATQFARGLQRHRHSCLCAFAEANTRDMTDVDISLPAETPSQPCRLIANDNPTRIVILPVLRNEGSDQRESKGLSSLIENLELESSITPIRISELRFSNRKYFAISRAAFHPSTTWLPESTAPSSGIQSLVPSVQNLIETPRLESLLTRTKHTTVRNPNQDKSGLLCRQDSLSQTPPLASAPARVNAATPVFARPRFGSRAIRARAASIAANATFRGTSRENGLLVPSGSRPATTHDANPASPNWHVYPKGARRVSQRIFAGCSAAGRGILKDQAK